MASNDWVSNLGHKTIEEIKQASNLWGYSRSIDIDYDISTTLLDRSVVSETEIKKQVLKEQLEFIEKELESLKTKIQNSEDLTTYRVMLEGEKLAMRKLKQKITKEIKSYEY